MNLWTAKDNPGVLVLRPLYGGNEEFLHARTMDQNIRIVFANPEIHIRFVPDV